MSKVWFEIGVKDVNGETHTIFSSDTLSEAVQEFKKQEYDKENYFIDTWENEARGCPVPIANIDLNTI